MTAEFFQACQQGDAAAVRQQLEQNTALANAQGTSSPRSHTDDSNNTPLMLATQAGHADVVRELLAHSTSSPTLTQTPIRAMPRHWFRPRTRTARRSSSSVRPLYTLTRASRMASRPLHKNPTLRRAARTPTCRRPKSPVSSLAASSPTAAMATAASSSTRLVR